MKTKIYNNLIFSLLFVCSVCGFFGGVAFTQSDNCVEDDPEADSIATGVRDIATELGFTLTNKPLNKIVITTNEGDEWVFEPCTDNRGRVIKAKLYRVDRDEIKGLIQINGIKNGGISEEDSDGDGTVDTYTLTATITIKGERPPTTFNSAQHNILNKKPLTLHLYSTIFGVGKEIKTSSNDRESVSRTVQGIFARFFSIIFTLSGILMVTLLAVYGTRMIYAEFGGNVTAFSDAKGRVISAAMGTAILLLSWVILNFIAPSLLRPRLFQTITGLQEVGSGTNLLVTDLFIPDAKKNITYKNGTITINACPEMKDIFRQQVESLREQLQHDKKRIEPKYAYQVLYQNYTDEKIYIYNKGREDIPYDQITTSGGNNLASSILASNIPAGQVKQCGRLPIQAEGIPLSAGNIVVFPVVYIEVGEEGSPPQIKKFWRGSPWRWGEGQKTKNRVKAILASDSNFYSVTVNDASDTTTADDLYISITSPSDESTLKDTFKVTGDPTRIEVEYLIHGIPWNTLKIAPNNNQECNQITFSGGSVIKSEDSGEQKIFCTKNNPNRFSITPKLRITYGVGRGATAEPISGEKACFSIDKGKREDC